MMLFFALLYTRGLWGRIGVPSQAVEAVLSVLLVVVLLSERAPLSRLAPGFLFVWFYFGWSVSACIHNGEGVMRGFLYSRYLVAAYIMFWTVWNSTFTRKQLSQINMTIAAVFLLQVAAALVAWLVLGEQVEANVGTLGYEGGAIATVFPMFAFSCLFAFFMYYKKLVLLILALSFFLVGHASGKLAIYYFIPLMLVLGLVLYAAAEGLPSAIKRGLVTGALGICALPFLLFLLVHSPRTEKLQDEASVRDVIASFLDLSRNTALENKSWYTSSRNSTSMRVIQETFQRSPSVFLFGQGTHTVFERDVYDEYGIIYGLVGWGTDALAVGWPAMFAHVGFYIYLFHLLLKANQRLSWGIYWKSILLTAQLGFFVFLIDYYFYSNQFTVGGWVSSVYLYFLAVLLAPQYQKALCIHQTASHPPASNLRRWADRRESPCRISWPTPTRS